MSLGPGRFTLITQRGENAQLNFWEDGDPVESYIFHEITLLTESQRTPEWFLLRKFRITGTSAMAVWRIYARNDENVNAVLQALSLAKKQSVNDQSTIVYTQDGLSAMVLLPDLCELCRNKSLPVSGTKSILIKRILASQVTLCELSQLLS